jgi:hypothetical protein
MAHLLTQDLVEGLCGDEPAQYVDLLCRYAGSVSSSRAQCSRPDKALLYSTEAPVSLTTFVHLSISDAINLVYSACVPPTRT